MMAIVRLESISYGRHRSHQLTDADLVGADLVMAMEADHVRYVRRHHPQARAYSHADPTLCDDEFGPSPSRANGRLRVRGVELGDERTWPTREGTSVYLVCARQLGAHRRVHRLL